MHFYRKFLCQCHILFSWLIIQDNNQYKVLLTIAWLASLFNQTPRNLYEKKSIIIIFVLSFLIVLIQTNNSVTVNRRQVGSRDYLYIFHLLTLMLQIITDALCCWCTPASLVTKASPPTLSAFALSEPSTYITCVMNIT